MQAVFMEVVCREPRWDFLVLAEGLLVTLEVAKMVFLFLRPMEKSRDLDIGRRKPLNVSFIY